MDPNTEVYGQQLLALIRKLTEADGDITSNERSWLNLLKKEFGTKESPEAKFDPEALKAAVSEAGERTELIQLLLMVSLSDGQTTPDEWELIQQVGSHLELSAEQLETLRQETVLAVDP